MFATLFETLKKLKDFLKIADQPLTFDALTVTYYNTVCKAFHVF